MVTLALVIFGVTALGGLYLASRHFAHQPMPGPVALIHGVAGATALVILAFAVLARDPGRAAGIALAIFVVTALGGFYLVTFHLRAERHPSPMVIGHGALAVVAFVVLATTLFS
jgi:disulfide bond formation protein DsbB